MDTLGLPETIPYFGSYQRPHDKSYKHEVILFLDKNYLRLYNESKV